MSNVNDANFEHARRKVERLKKIGENKNLIKSPYYNNPNTNPCIKEQNASRKCYIDHDFDKDACKDYYDNYNICMKFWNLIEWDRRMAGITPALPPPEERPAIMEKRMHELTDKDNNSPKNILARARVFVS